MSQNRLSATEQEEAEAKLNADPAFVFSPRYKNDIKKVRDRYPNGAPDHIVGPMVFMDEEQLSSRFSEITTCLRTKMVVESEDGPDIDR